MRALSLLEGERKSGAIRYVLFRQSPKLLPQLGPGIVLRQRRSWSNVKFFDRKIGIRAWVKFEFPVLGCFQVDVLALPA